MAVTARYTERLTVSLTPAQHERLTKIADERYCSIADVIRDAVNAWVAQPTKSAADVLRANGPRLPS